MIFVLMFHLVNMIDFCKHWFILDWMQQHVSNNRHRKQCGCIVWAEMSLLWFDRSWASLPQVGRVFQ